MPATLLTSTRPVALIERLALDLGAEPLGPFAEELVIVQSQGMARFVRHELARRHGCAASLALPFPAKFARDLARKIDGAPLDERFDRDALVWRILSLLEDGLAEEPGFEPVHAFAAKADTRTRLGLASRVASRLDDYQLYRPDVLLAWERGESAAADAPELHWQAELWRRLTSGGEPPRHLARWLTGAIDRLERGDIPADCLPPRVSVFGVSTLPPLFVRVLQAASRHVPVRAYLLAPPRATWANGTDDAPANPLFAAFGHASRALLGLLTVPENVRIDELDAPDESAPATVLARLQSDLRAGLSRGPEAGLEAPAPLAPTDDSLTVHVCHSPMREMEALRDRLLAAFAADPNLRPHDVLVMVPDVATYAPFVEAVFGVVEPELPRIPFHIADRPVVQESSAADALLRILRLAGARWTAAEIVELLDLPAVRRAAGVPASATARILGWIEETRIRWGRDGAMRKERFNLPGVEANSWRAGLDRLLMGYAVGRAETLVADVLPCAGDTVGDPATLGAFCRWVDRLFDALDALREPRALDAWQGAVHELMATLLEAEDDEEERELAWLRGAVAALARAGAAAGVRRAVDLSVVRDWLELELAGDGLGAGFLRGGMTFCALKPMRAIPFRVIAVAGLDDATFPRRGRRARYDLLEVEPRPGDRDLRADDRQLFLDTLLAARDRVVLSYVGRSATDNTERAASVVVAELLDVVDRSFTNPARDAKGKRLRARDALVVEHRLQPFSPAYYAGDARLFSYSRANARAVDARGAGKGAAPFVDAPIAGASDGKSPERLVVSIRELVACWTNPSRYFNERVLGLRLAGEEEPLDDCEPMGVDRLLQYGVHDEILKRHLRGARDPERERAIAVARGILPSGALAARWYDRLDGEIAAFLEGLGRPTACEPLGVEVEGPDWTIVGRLDGLTEEGRLHARPAKLRPKDLASAWIHHLVLAAAHGDVPSRVVGFKSDHVLNPVEDPLGLLDALVDGVRANQRAPLPVFERASHAYVDRLLKEERGTSRSAKPPIDAARAEFAGNDFTGGGDGADAHVALCWRGRDPFADEESFARWAETLWRPALTMIADAKEARA